MVAIPLTLPMGWKNSTPIFFMDTETVVGLANAALFSNQTYCNHKMYARVETLVILDSPSLQAPLSGLILDPYLSHTNSKPTAYVDVFIGNFLGLAQGPAHRRRHAVRTLFYAMKKVLQPLDPADMAN